MRFDRRTFLSILGTAAAAAALKPTAGFCADISNSRTLRMRRTGTDEVFTGTYFKNGFYELDQLVQINHFMRDIHTGEEELIDPAVLDQIFLLQARISNPEPFEVVCGHRSHATNDALIEAGYPAASNSFHIIGKAVDLFHPKTPLYSLHRMAEQLKSGGVGFYPDMNFLHLDSGPVRSWSA